MGIFTRAPRITKLAYHLAQVEQGLHHINGSDRVPSPLEMEAFKYIRYQLRELDSFCTFLEPKLWERVEEYRKTPYNPKQRLIRRLCAFIGYWLFGVFVIHSGGLWLLDKFLPQPTSLIIAAVLSFIAVIFIMRSERGEE
jgi:hypothetical protein